MLFGKFDGLVYVLETVNNEVEGPLCLPSLRVEIDKFVVVRERFAFVDGLRHVSNMKTTGRAVGTDLLEIVRLRRFQELH